MYVFEYNKLVILQLTYKFHTCTQIHACIYNQKGHIRSTSFLRLLPYIYWASIGPHVISSSLMSFYWSISHMVKQS